MIIDGKIVESPETFVHTSPIDTRLRLGYFSRATTEHVQRAIKAAKRAFEEWRRTDYKYRIGICVSAANLIAKRKFEFAAMDFL